MFNYDDEFSSSTSFIDMSISDPLFSSNSMATSTPIKQNRSNYTNCKFVSSSYYIKIIKK